MKIGNTNNVGADASVCPTDQKINIHRRGTGHRAQKGTNYAYNTGITLISLIITIIVLIILAGVTLNVTLGENGILNKSKNAVDKYKDAEKQEQSELDKALGEIENANSELYIPEGFKHTEGSIDTGYVIQNETTGDEFVWIPVETPVAENEAEITTLNAEGKYPMAVKTEGTTNGLQNYRGVLYDFDINETGDAVTIKAKSYNATSGYREPANLETSYDNTSRLSEWTETLYQGEYNELVASVIANKGFYIGRYESGNLSETAVSKKGETGINNQTWYQMYKAQKNIYGDSGSTKTHMIWGSQFDQVLIWMKDVPNTSENAKEEPFYILNSTDMGVYDNNSSEYWNGTAGKFEVKNLYDIAGNAWEWTMEAVNDVYRVLRGGVYGRNGTSYPASCRDCYYPSDSYDSRTSRLTLYK